MQMFHEKMQIFIKLSLSIIIIIIIQFCNNLLIFGYMLSIINIVVKLSSKEINRMQSIEMFYILTGLGNRL